MKVFTSPVPVVIALLLGALIGWAIFALSSCEDVRMAFAVVTGIVIFVTCGVGLTVRSDDSPRSAWVIRSVSMFVAVLLALVDVLFAIFATTLTWFVIVNGILFLIYLLAVYGVSRSKQ